MKKLFVFAMALCLLAPMSMAQVSDSNYTPGKLLAFQTTRGLGDVNWTLDMETPTGDNRLLGVEFDGANYWATGAFDFTIAYLYEISAGGTVVNTYPQPTANWGGWGWRDLAFDGTYLYTGNPNAGYIVQVDPANGLPTGVQYGPFPVTPCRALAYDPAEDCFWTASFTSSLYKCFKDGTSQTFTNPGLSCYGAAHSPNGIWWWSQDGNGSLGSLMAMNGTFTGDTFDGDLSMGGGIAGGAGAYDLGGNNWELVGMHQGTPDYAAGYDINMSLDPLTVSSNIVSAYLGGTLNFALNGGPDLAGRPYALLGTFSGIFPGTLLPGGMHLPINMDWFSDLLLNMALSGGYGLVNDFIGTLSAEGSATASLIFPGHCQLYEDLTANFAWCTYAPFNFVSNGVEVLVTGKPAGAEEYAYDDMSAENLLGYGTGGDMCWVNWFEVIPGMETINEVGSGFGSTTYVGYGMNNGDPATIFVWNAPAGANDLTVGVLLDTVNVTVQNNDMDFINWYSLNGPQTFTSAFFVGCMVTQPAGTWVYPMDESSNPTGGQSWFLGSPSTSGPVDPANPGINADCDPMKNIGFDSYAIVRAK
ncbi:MAG: hypothetical protein ABIK28_00660 [Planctomycetota bacterium]